MSCGPSPRVSVVVPAYNATPFIRRTLESVLGQTFTDLEVVVVDDRSSDGTFGMVASFGRPVVAVAGQGLGVSAARNEGVRRSRGEFVAFMDHDDVWRPDKLFRQVRALDQDFVPEETPFSVLTTFNQMYGFVFRYMVREVGPIAENVLEKYLAGLRDARKPVFGGVKLLNDGTLAPAVIERNLNALPEDQRRPQLVDALNELLYAELLAVKRTLGAEHEANIVRALKDR